MSEHKTKTFISYLDDNDEQVDGYFDLIEITTAYVKFSNEKNTLTIPIHRIKKVKEMN